MIDADNNKTEFEKNIEEGAAEMLKRYSDGHEGSFNYKKLLEDTKRNSENEYKRIAVLAHSLNSSYKFKDPQTHKEVQKWLISTRKKCRMHRQRIRAIGKRR